MTKKFKLPRMVWASLMVVLLIGLYFAENIKGQVRFMQYCWKEGGLKVYEPLERDVGWEAEDYYYAKNAASIDGVGFVRFYDKKQDAYMDVTYVGGNVHRDTSYRADPADLEKSIQYTWESGLEYIAGELRLIRLYQRVRRESDRKLLVRYNSFSYSQFDPQKTLGPSDVYCDPKAPPDGVGDNESSKAINSAFKK